MTARVQVLPRTYPKYQPELDRRVKQRESYGGDLPMLRFLGVAAGHQPPDDTERSLTQDEVVIQGKWVRSFRAFDTYNVYQSDQAIEIRHILDKDPAPRKDRKTKTSASSAFGKALRILLYYLLNTRVLQTYGWTPEPVAKLTPPGELAQRVDEPGDKFETAIARLTPDWVNWVLKRVQQLNEKIDDLPASSGDQLFYRAHVYTPGKIRKFQAIRNLELLASHLYYIINPSLRPDSTSLDAMDWGQENNQAIEEQGFLLEHAECIQRHIDQEQDPEAKARLAEARLNVTSTGGHYDSAFMRSMIISPLVLLSDAQVDTIQVTYAVGLQTILVQAQRVRPAMLVNVENLLLRQLLLVADGKQTVIDLLRNMHSALDAMKDLDNVSLEDRQFFANMLNPPELTSPSPTPPPPSPSPSVPAGAHEALDHLPGDDSGTVGEKRKRTTTDKQGLGQGTETSSDLVSSPTKEDLHNNTK